MTWLLDKLGLSLPATMLFFGLGAWIGYTFAQVASLGELTPQVATLNARAEGFALLYGELRGDTEALEDALFELAIKVAGLGRETAATTRATTGLPLEGAAIFDRVMPAAAAPPP